MNFAKILKNYKMKPTQFQSAAGGKQKRLNSTEKIRKSTRLTAFDKGRDLESCSSSELPQPPEPPMSKSEHRRAQLQKWKEAKEAKRKEEAAKKKKPFHIGLPKDPCFPHPPPLPSKASASGCQTRSMTGCKTRAMKRSPVKSVLKAQFFAPLNATFKAPTIVPRGPEQPISSSGSDIDSRTTFDEVQSGPSHSGYTARTKSKSHGVKRTEAFIRLDPIRPTLSRGKAFDINSSSESDMDGPKTTNRIKKSQSYKKGIGAHGKDPFKPSSSRGITGATSSSEGNMDSLKTVNRIQNPTKSFRKAKKPTPNSLVKASSCSGQSDDKFDINSRRKSLRQSKSSSDIMARDGAQSSVDEEPSSPIQRKNLNTEKKSPVVVLTRSLPGTPQNLPGTSKIHKSSLEVDLDSWKPVIDFPLTPEQIEEIKNNPFVTMSRGKENERKEMIWKYNEGLLEDDDLSETNHFRKQLSAEISKLTELSDSWEKISSDRVLPEAVQEAVLSAVGQARLLKSSKMQQFATLIEQCAESDPDSKPITPDDLQGFWDMVSIQVKNVYIRFEKLEELRARNFIEEPKAQGKKAAKEEAAGRKRPPKAQVNKAAKLTAGPSRLQELIAAKRKAKKDQGADNSLLEFQVDEEKKFDAGFFYVRSPQSHVPNAKASPATPLNRGNLRKAVLSNEANKASASKKATPFAIMRASIMGKSAGWDGVAPLPQTPQLTPINLFATPGRSILKSGKKETGSAKKCIKTVIFHDSDDSSSPNNSSARGSEQSVISGVTPLENIENEGKSLEEEKTPTSEKNKRRQTRRTLQDIQNLEDSIVHTKSPNISKAEENTPVAHDFETPRRSERVKRNNEEKTVELNKTLEKSAEVNSSALKEGKRRASRKKPVKECEENVAQTVSPTTQRSLRPTPQRTRRKTQL